MVEIAAVRAAAAASLSFAATAASTFLMDVFTADLMDLFLSAFVLFTRILFLADLMLAKLYTSNILNFIVFLHRGRHGNPRRNMLIYSMPFICLCQYIFQGKM